MASSSVASSTRQNPSLGDLHRHVMDVAANRVGVPAMPAAFIGPARPTSAYLGEVTMIAGPENETAVRVMFRCVWGPRAPSRHVLVWLKPSVSEEALALRLCQIFDIPTIGNVTIELVFKWMLGLMPYGEEMDKVLPFAEVVRTLGSTMGGIVDLDVLICEEQFGGCSVCENGAGLASAARRNARTWGIGESVLCERCARCMGIPGDFPQADLGNGYIRVTPLEY